METDTTSQQYPETQLTTFDVNSVHVNYFQYKIFGQYKCFFKCILAT